MADLLAQGYITIAVVNDGYSLSLTTSSVSIPANHDGSDPDLSCAYTNVSLSKGNASQPIEIINVIPSTNGIQYTYVPAGPYNWKVSIIGLASDITSGYLDIIVRTPDGYQTSARFNFSVVRNTTSLDWIEEWNGTHTQIGSNYVITPKLFAGHKTSEGKITGIYLGKLKGFIGEVFPFTLSDAEEGLYGYRDNKIVFYIDNNGARIGGWDITPDSIQCLDGTLTIKSEGAISSQSDGIEHWALKKDGSASFANGKVTMDAKGNASFDGHIIARSGELAGWTIGEQSIYKVGVAINSSRRFIAAANVITSELEGDQFDWVKQYGGAAMYYISNADYGFIGYKGDKLMFSAGSTNYIAGWNFDESAFWLGTKNNNVGQFTKDASSITIGTNGIRGYKFYLDKNGAGALAGGNIKWDAAGNVTFGASVILNWTNAAQEAADAAKDEAIDEAQKAAEAAEAAAKELASAMAFGKMLYRDPTFAQGGNGISVYNNSGNGTVTITRTSSSTVPNDSGKMLTIKNTGTASPYCGGFSFTTQCGYRKIFITRIIAKIPVGRDITFHTNSIGTGGTQKWLTPTKGTGDWQEYICKVYCGTANFSSTHFFAITGNYNVTWYLAYATVFDVTTSERYTTTIDANGIYTATLNANQITAGTIDADRIGAKSITADKIAANTITSAQINGDSIKANIINTNYINGLSCTFTKGTIGGWTIGANSITKNSVSLGSDGTISNGSYWSLKNDGSGFFAKGNITWKTDGTFEAKNGKFTGEIQTTKGTIGGFEIASGRIGVATSSGATSGNSGLSILQDFIKFSNSYCWASIGVNVLPSSTGIVGVGRFANSTPNSYGTNYGLLINVSGAQQNIGIVSNGAVVCNSYITDYGISKLTPSANTCFVPGDITKPNLFKLLVSFVNDNAGVGLPTRTSVCSVLGISSSTAFAVRITIICDRSSSKTGYVCGRNTFVDNGTMNNNYYPYMLNQNADNQTGKWNMARGDTREFMLVWDGSSNYYAYLLNISE